MILERGYGLPQDHFTIIPNAWLRDERLSRKARGLLAELMSHQAGWQTSVEQLSKVGPEGPAALKAGLKELEEAGYLVRTWIRDERGRRAGTKYVITDPAQQNPRSEPSVENRLMDDSPSVDFPPVDKPPVANRTTKKNNLLEHQDEEEHNNTAQAANSLVEPAGDVVVCDESASQTTNEATGDEIRQLAAACKTAGLPARFDRLKSADKITISRLVNIHGVAALVAHALKMHRPHNPTLYASGWITGWSALPEPNTTPTSTPSAAKPPKCDECDEYGWLPDDEDGRAVMCPCGYRSAVTHAA